jgi:hypothetical protein
MSKKELYHNEYSYDLPVRVEELSRADSAYVPFTKLQQPKSASKMTQQQKSINSILGPS